MKPKKNNKFAAKSVSVILIATFSTASLTNVHAQGGDVAPGPRSQAEMEKASEKARIRLRVPELPEEELDKLFPLTMAKALELGKDKLDGIYGSTEDGDGDASRKYAIAKKLETELALAEIDLDLIAKLESWRSRICELRVSCYHLASLAKDAKYYYRIAAADVAAQEDFLARFSKRLPLAVGKGDPAATEMITKAMARLKALKFEGDDNWRREQLAEEMNRAMRNWDMLKHILERMPAEDAKAVATFATGTLGCLEDRWKKPDEEKKAE